MPWESFKPGWDGRMTGRGDDNVVWPQQEGRNECVTEPYEAMLASIVFAWYSQHDDEADVRTMLPDLDLRQ